MNDYISRESAYKAITRTCNKNCKGQICLYTEDMLDDIEDIPAVDVRPEKYGKWKDGEKSQVCTICGGWGLDSFAYCPHCGARMEGKQNA